MGKVDAVGASFGVLKYTSSEGENIDFSLPRRDSKVASGHKGFLVEVDPSMTTIEAAARRDFTINSMMFDMDGNLIDHFGGREDLREGILRHTSEHFAEDPLRVLRAFQFAGRFGFSVAPETVELCRSLRSSFQELPPERVWAEFEKWAAKSIKPSAGLRFLQQCGWLDCFPALFNMVGCPQDPLWHPEGDAWVHTLEVCDAAVAIATRDGLDQGTLVLGSLLHDCGKPITTKMQGGRWVSPGHAESGVKIARRFLDDMKVVPGNMIAQVENLVLNHMAYFGDCTPKKVRRFVFNKLKVEIPLLRGLIEADHSGRPPLPAGLPAEAEQFCNQVTEFLKSPESVSLIKGADLIERGWKPGRNLGAKLRELREAQVERGLNREELLELIHE